MCQKNTIEYRNSDMSNDDNGANEITLGFSIPELGLIAAAMHMGGITTYARSGGKNARDPYFSMAERARKICPLPQHGGREYGWFDGFTALENGKSYSVYLDSQPRKSFEPDDDESLQLVLIVDGKRFNLTDCLKVDVKGNPIPAEYLEMLEETDKLAKRAAHLNCERNASIEFTLQCIDPPRGFKSSKSQERREVVSRAIAEKIGGDLERQDFYVTSIRREFRSRNWDDVKVTVVGPADRIEQIKVAFDLEPTQTLSI
jgi:hypothetical protein